MQITPPIPDVALVPRGRPGWLFLMMLRQTLSCTLDLLHALGALPRHVDELVHFKSRLHDMQVAVQGRAITPLCYYGDLR